MRNFKKSAILIRANYLLHAVVVNSRKKCIRYFEKGVQFYPGLTTKGVKVKLYNILILIWNNYLQTIIQFYKKFGKRVKFHPGFTTKEVKIKLYNNLILIWNNYLYT